MSTNTISRVGSGSPYEAEIGFSRAVRTGNQVLTTLTGPVMPAGEALPGTAYGQGERCLEILASALAKLGCSLDDVIRTEIYFVDDADVDDIFRLHREVFGDVMPVTKILRTPELTDPRWKIEIELEATVRAASADAGT